MWNKLTQPKVQTTHHSQHIHAGKTTPTNINTAVNKGDTTGSKLATLRQQTQEYSSTDSPSDSDYSSLESHNQTTEIRKITRKKVTLRERVSTQRNKLPTGTNKVESEDTLQSQSDSEEEHTLSTTKIKGVR
jgi:hypothetical protein